MAGDPSGKDIKALTDALKSATPLIALGYQVNPNRELQDAMAKILEVKTLSDVEQVAFNMHENMQLYDIPTISSGEKDREVLPGQMLSTVMNRKRGLRVLCIDGGGMRGVAAIQFLICIEKKLGKSIAESFDLICGTSTGGIIAAVVSLASSLNTKDSKDNLVPMTLAGLMSMYKNMGETVFPPFEYLKTLHWAMHFFQTKALYDHKELEKIMQGIFGDFSLVSEECKPDGRFSKVKEEVEGYTKKTKKIVPRFMFTSVDVTRSAGKTKDTPVLFSNFTLSKKNSNEIQVVTDAFIWEALRCTSAAPLYLSQYQRNKETEDKAAVKKMDIRQMRGRTYIDGGVGHNNPSFIALHQAIDLSKELFGEVRIDCVVSLGTGEMSSNTVNNSISTKGNEKDEYSSVIVHLATVVKTLLEATTSTSHVDWAINKLSQHLKYYYMRINTPVDEVTSLSDVDPEKLNKLIEGANKHWKTILQQMYGNDMEKIFTKPHEF